MAVGGLALVGVPGMTAVMVKLMGYGQVKRLGLGIPIVFPAAVAIGVVADRARRWVLAASAAAIGLASLALHDDGFPWSWPSLVTAALVVAALVAIAIAVVFWLRRWPIPAPPDVGAPLWAAALLTVALLLGSVLTDRHAIARALLRDRSGSAEPPDQPRRGGVLPLALLGRAHAGGAGAIRHARFRRRGVPVGRRRARVRRRPRPGPHPRRAARTIRSSGGTR